MLNRKVTKWLRIEIWGRSSGDSVVKTLTYRVERFNLKCGGLTYKRIIFVLDLNTKIKRSWKN